MRAGTVPCLGAGTALMTVGFLKLNPDLAVIGFGMLAAGSVFEVFENDR